MNRTPDQVTEYLHEHIPVTRQMGIRVVVLDETSLRIAAPLDPNRNHRDTAFAGSITTVAVLAGWTLLYLKLADERFDGRLVIQKSSVDFLVPVEGDFEAVSTIPSEREWRRFKSKLSRKGKARITLRSVLLCDTRTVAVHEGRYVAVRVPGDAA